MVSPMLSHPMSILMPGLGSPWLHRPPRHQPLPRHRGTALPRRAVRAERAASGDQLRLVTTEAVPGGAVLLRETALFLTSPETATEEMGRISFGK